MTTEFWGLLPGGELPSAAHAQMQADVDAKVAGRVADMEAIRDAAEDARDATLAAAVITGTGRPDIPATMTAPVAALVAAAGSGAVFRSTDGPQGAWQWQKRGTTWAAVVADTGWRNIATLLETPANWTPPTGSASEYLEIRRVGAEVTLRARMIRSAAGAGGNRVGPETIITPPTGFRGAKYATYGTSHVGTDIGVVAAITTTAVAQVAFIPGVWTAGDRLFLCGTWLTDNSYPTTLPGTAA